MSKQSPAAHVPGYIRPGNDTNPFINSSARKERRHLLADLFSNLNPANWFNEFTHIEITMEEFDVKRPTQFHEVKDWVQGSICYNGMDKSSWMKSLSRVSRIILFVLLSAKSFGQVITHADERTRFKALSDSHGSNTGTPVYSKLKTDTIGVLEMDNPEVASNFAAVFPLAENQIWIREAGSLYVSFICESKKISAVFNPKGSMSYSIASIRLADIPAAIIEKLKSGYNGYSIVSAKEIIVDASTVYQVLLENLFQYVSIRFSNDDMEETERVKKIL